MSVAADTVTERPARAPAPDAVPGTDGPRSRGPRIRGRRAQRWFPVLLVGLCACLGASIIAGVAFGAVHIAPGRVWSIILHELIGRDLGEGVPVSERQIVWELRLPRTLLAALVGGGLALVGVAIQALVRNPLADPYILGVSSGASVGAALVILFGWFSGLGMYALSGAAFLGALAAMLVVFLVAQQGGRIIPLRLVLGGVAVGYVLSGITSFLIFKVDPRASQAVVFWILGSFGRARWAYVPLPAIVLLAGAVYLVTRGRALNALVAGEETATTLGVGVARLRFALFFVSAAMTGVMVAVSGAIGFVGLIVPHVARMLVGADHRRVLPIAMLVGACFTVWVDVVARTVVAPQELPVGVITAMIGGPLFLLLMRRRLRTGELS